MTRKAPLNSLVVVGVFFSQLAWGAGLEKTVTWSGRYAGVANAATSSVDDSQALFFNPAALAGQGSNVSGNFSPIFAHYSGPVDQANTSLDSSRAFVPGYGVFAAYQVCPSFGVAIGTYASGGTKAIYDNIANVPSGAPGFSPSEEANLQINEYSLGAGYEVFPGLRIGAAWRIVHVGGDLEVMPPPTAGPVYVNTQFTNLSAWRYNGWRVGAQFAPKDAGWGLGFDWRSAVDFNASSTVGGNISEVVATAPIPSAPASLGARLPQEFSLAGHYDVMPGLFRAYLEYDFIQYHDDSQITVNTAPIGGQPVPSLPLQWSNLNIIRIAGEYTVSPNTMLRAGYAYTSQVTPSEAAQPYLSSPGEGNTVVLGGGYTGLIAGLSLDGAVEYSWASGHRSLSDAYGYAGDYKSNDYTLHFGTTYRF